MMFISSECQHKKHSKIRTCILTQRRQVARGSLNPTGATVAVLQHQFMLQVSDSKAQSTHS